MDTETLAACVARGWEDHAEQPRAVAAGLRARAATLSADADGAAAIGLAEHVWLSHLQDPSGLEDFLQALPAAVQQAERSGAMLRRARWVLATLADEPAPAIPDAARWCALQNLGSVWAERGRAAMALAVLEAERPKALAHPDAAARKALAIATHNLALELREGRRGDPARDALMLALADASRSLWATAGNWVNVERGDYELARCHAVLGQGEAALRHARACLASIEQHAGDPHADAFETFFAHEALAWAQRAAGDGAALAAERGHMKRLMAGLTDASLKPWCAAALAALDA
jgi:hypothetical protein